MKKWLHMGEWFLVPIYCLAGCGLTTPTVESRQADIGFGIVEGTKGIQKIQQDSKVEDLAKILRGQVIRLEGGAYVIRAKSGQEVRLPLDQYTGIDRPAHVGDWIEAQLDRRGRARHIRNVDDHMILELED